MALVLTQLAADTFHRANETLQDPPWHATDGGPCQIVSNQMMSKDLNEDAAIYNGVVLPNDQYIQWSMLLPANNGSELFALIRTDNSETNFYSVRMAQVDSTHIRMDLQLRSAGADLIHIVSTPFLTTDIFILAVVGSTFTLLQNGSILGTAIDSTVGSGKVGFDLSVNAAITDLIVTNFVCGSASGGNPPVPNPNPLQAEIHETYAPTASATNVINYSGQSSSHNSPGNNAATGTVPPAVINEPDDKIGSSSVATSNEGQGIVVSGKVIHGRFDLSTVINNPA